MIIFFLCNFIHCSEIESFFLHIVIVIEVPLWGEGVTLKGATEIPPTVLSLCERQVFLPHPVYAGTVCPTLRHRMLILLKKKTNETLIFSSALMQINLGK